MITSVPDDASSGGLRGNGDSGSAILPLLGNTTTQVLSPSLDISQRD
jgi:hypothetical protein